MRLFSAISSHVSQRCAALLISVSLGLTGCAVTAPTTADPVHTGASPVEIIANFSLPCGEIAGETVFRDGLVYVNLEQCPDGWVAGRHAGSNRGVVYDVQLNSGRETRLDPDFKMRAAGYMFAAISISDTRFIGADRKVYWIKKRSALNGSNASSDCGLGVIRLNGLENVRACLVLFSLSDKGEIPALPDAAFGDDVLQNTTDYAVGDGKIILGFDAKLRTPVMLKLSGGTWKAYRSGFIRGNALPGGEAARVERCAWSHDEVFLCSVRTAGATSEGGVVRLDGATGAATLVKTGPDGLYNVSRKSYFVSSGLRWKLYDDAGQLVFDTRTDSRGLPPEEGYGGKNRVWGGYSAPRFSPDGGRLYAIRSAKEFDIFESAPFRRVTTLSPGQLGLPYFQSYEVDPVSGWLLFCSKLECVVVKGK